MSETQKEPIIFLDDISVTFKTRTALFCTPTGPRGQSRHHQAHARRDHRHRRRVRLRQVHHRQRHVRSTERRRPARSTSRARTSPSAPPTCARDGSRGVGRLPGPRDRAQRPHDRPRPASRPAAGPQGRQHRRTARSASTSSSAWSACPRAPCAPFPASSRAVSASASPSHVPCL